MFRGQCDVCRKISDDIESCSDPEEGVNGAVRDYCPSCIPGPLRDYEEDLMEYNDGIEDEVWEPEEELDDYDDADE